MFKNWCKEQKFTTKTNVSHVLMDGGFLSVPFDRLDEFRQRYIDAICSGEQLFVVEQKTPTYNFFVDIDYKDNRALTLEEIQDICKIICDKVKRHGGKECLISVSPPKKSGEYIKTGIHMNWNGFVVDQVSALALREHILVALSKAKGASDWNEIIDSSVYGILQRKTKGSGLRMPWSHKIAKHMTCSGRGCDGCEKTGKIVEVAYLPLFIYKHGPLSSLLRIEQHPDVNILKMSEVRTNETSYVTIEHPIVVREGSFSDTQTNNELYDEELKLMIQDFVQQNMEGQSDAIITKIFKHMNTYLISTTSKYCENLKRVHSSNHIWFYISGRVITQKCFCRCETIRDRRDGFCKDFFGRQHQLHPNIIDKLYKDRSEINSCPNIKKIEERPQIKQSDVKPKLETFIRRFMKGQENTNVVSLKRDKSGYLVTTTSHYCETIKGDHEDATVSYLIDKYTIKQKCHVCTKQNTQSHRLSASVISELYPPQKK